MKKLVTIVGLGLLLSTSAVFAQSEMQRPGDASAKLAEARRGRDTKIQDLDEVITDLQNIMNLRELQNPEIRRAMRSAIFKIEDVQIKIYQEQNGGHNPVHPTDQNGPIIPGNGHGQNGPVVINQCPGNICIGDLVFQGTFFSKGGTLMAANYNQGTATVKSINAGSLHQVNLADLDASRGCVMGACVGDVIYSPARTYSQGATVLGINDAKRTLTVKSVSSGKLYVEDASTIQVTTQSSAYSTQQRKASNK